MRQTEMFSSVA